MVCVCLPCVRWAPLLALLVCVFAQDSSRECLDKDELIAEMPSTVDLPTECVLTCTALTYRQILDTQRRVTVRFRDSRPGEDGDEFCWLISSRCSTWDEVLVLLSLSQSDAATEARIRLQTDSLILVEPQDSPSVLPDDCGLRFDVTAQLQGLRQHTLCVRPHGIMGNQLQCPPALVFVKQKQKESRS